MGPPRRKTPLARRCLVATAFVVAVTVMSLNFGLVHRRPPSATHPMLRRDNKEQEQPPQTPAAAAAAAAGGPPPSNKASKIEEEEARHIAHPQVTSSHTSDEAPPPEAALLEEEEGRAEEQQEEEQGILADLQHRVEEIDLHHRRAASPGEPEMVEEQEEEVVEEEERAAADAAAWNVGQEKEEEPPVVEAEPSAAPTSLGMSELLALGLASAPPAVVATSKAEIAEFSLLRKTASKQLQKLGGSRANAYSKKKQADGDAVDLLQNALRFGDPSGPRPTPDQLFRSHEETVAYWNALKPELEAATSSFSVVWMGCVDGSNLLPHKIAVRYPSATVLAIHACASSPDSMAFRENRAAVGSWPNLVIVEGLPEEDDDDGTLRVWRTLGGRGHAADWVLVSQRALEDLVEAQLPHEVEASLRGVLKWAGVMMVPKQQQRSSFLSANYWPGGTEDLLRRAKPSESSVETVFAAGTTSEFHRVGLPMTYTPTWTLASNRSTSARVPLGLLLSVGIAADESLRLAGGALAGAKTRDLRCALSRNAPLSVEAGRLVATSSSCDGLDAERRARFVLPSEEDDAREEESTSTAGMLVRLSRSESATVRRWALAAKKTFKTDDSVLAIGEEIGLVALKAARKLRGNVVVAWSSEERGAEAQSLLATTARCANAVSAKAAQSLETLRGLRGEFGTVLIGAARLVQWLVGDGDDAQCSLKRLERRLGAALATARRGALLEMPRLQTLSALLDQVHPACSQELAAYLNASSPEHRLIQGALSSAELQADAIITTRTEKLVSVETPLLFQVSWGAFKEAKNDEFIKLSTLNQLGLVGAERAAVLKAHLALPLWRLPASEEACLSQLLYSPSRRVVRISCGELQLESEEASKAETWAVLRTELEQTPAEGRNGLFSLVEWGARSENESLSLDVASAFSESTVITIMGGGPVRGLAAAERLYSLAVARDVKNVVCCGGVEVDSSLVEKWYESPEFARYAFYQPTLTSLLSTTTDWPRFLGFLLSSALTTFLRMPDSRHVSLAMDAVFPTSSEDDYARLQSQLLSRLSVTGSTKVAFRCQEAGEMVAPKPLCRVDVLNLTREVHHHFDWARDGHRRTYTMKVDVNETKTAKIRRRRADDDEASWARRSWRAALGATLDGNRELGGGLVEFKGRSLALSSGEHLSEGRVLHVRLGRSHDAHYIPYGAIRSLTLIAALRLGLVPQQREAAFSDFVKLPLYEDMAPWNVAFAGDSLHYIDYDTRGTTYDTEVAAAYRVLSVLMNYKRTVTDLGKCGSRSPTDYGFSHVSECVRPQIDRKCDNSTIPVPCDDGNCHSDYVSCLRALSKMQDLKAVEARRSQLSQLPHASLTEADFPPQPLVDFRHHAALTPDY